MKKQSDLKLEEHILIVLFKIRSTTKRYKFNIKVLNNILKSTAVCSTSWGGGRQGAFVQQTIIMFGQPFE